MNKEEFNALVKKIDKEVLDPTQRAEKVWHILLDFSEKREKEKEREGESPLTDWDIVCFCTEFLAMLSLTKMDYVNSIARELTRLVYTQHYMSLDTFEEERLQRPSQFKQPQSKQQKKEDASKTSRE